MSWEHTDKTIAHFALTELSNRIEDMKAIRADLDSKIEDAVYEYEQLEKEFVRLHPPEPYPDDGIPF